jgi:hypothetical protein
MSKQMCFAMDLWISKLILIPSQVWKTREDL